MSIITEAMKMNIAFTEGIFSFSGPLSLHLIEELSDKEINYQNVSKAIYDFTSLLGQFDFLELPTGVTFENARHNKD